MEDQLHASVPVQVTREDLLHSIRRDCVTFLSFYLQDELTLEVPELHIEIWDEFLEYLERVRNPRFLIGQLRKLFCVPRGHAKSTLSKLAVILFMRYSPLAFTVYASNTSAISKAAIKDIVNWLKSPQEAELYGTPEYEKANESEGLWIYHIWTPEYGKKRIILKAVGADAQIRGMLQDNKRPDLIVVDDCEDLSTASSETTQTRLDEWLLGSLLKATAKRALVIMLGNLIKKTTLIARLAKEKSWNPTVFGSIVKDKNTGQLVPLWPGLYTLDVLLEEYAFYRRQGRGHVWIHEMMNLTAEDVFGIDMAGAVQIPVPNPDMLSAGCLVLDPAFGQNAWNDDSAITVHVQLKDGHTYGAGIPHIVGSICGRMTEDEMLSNLLELSQYWGINTWCIEAVAAQRLLIPYFHLNMRLRGLNPDGIVMLPITGGKEAKSSRIFALRNSVASGSYGIAEGLDSIFDKLLGYDPETVDHDDEVDSGALGMVAWASHGKAIESNGIVNVAMMLMPSDSDNSGVSQLEICPF